MASDVALEGKRIDLAIIEPWDFDPSSTTATIEGWKTGSDFAVVKLEKTTVFKGQNCTYFRMKPRRAKERIESILDGSTIDCSLVLVDKNSVGHMTSDFLDGWKNDIGLIASVKMTK